jgi:hypothetical protein
MPRQRILLPPSPSAPSAGSASSASAGRTFIAWSSRNGIHSISTAIGSLIKPNRTITIQIDMTRPMLLLADAGEQRT